MSCSTGDKLKYWNSSWWIERHAVRTPSRILSDWFLCVARWVCHVGCDRSKKPENTRREAVLCPMWSVTLRPWVAICRWSQSWCNSDTQCKENTGGNRSSIYWSLWIMEIIDNVKVISCFKSYSNLNIQRLSTLSMRGVTRFYNENKKWAIPFITIMNHCRVILKGRLAEGLLMLARLGV